MKYDSSINAAISAEHSNLPNVEIKGYSSAGAGLARVVVDVVHTSESRANPQLVAQSLCAKLGNKMSVIANTFTSIDKSRITERLAGVVGIARQVVAATKDMKGFRASASNMFMDEEKNMWVMRKTEAGNILIKTTGVDDDTSLLGLLESCSSANPHSLEFRAYASSTLNPQGGDFVSYVSADNTVRTGFVAASVADSDDLIVIPVGSETNEAVKKGAVTEVHDQSEFPETEDTAEGQVDAVVAASRATAGLDTILSYYKRVYARSPAFFKEFEKRVLSHKFM